MINTDSDYLLMIEPSSAPSIYPVIDRVTRLMAGAWAALRTESEHAYRGVHQCTGAGCMAVSDNRDHEIGGRTTHSLAVHYLACHRADVPDSELLKVLALAELGAVEADPADSLLQAGRVF